MRRPLLLYAAIIGLPLIGAGLFLISAGTSPTFKAIGLAVAVCGVVAAAAAARFMHGTDAAAVSNETILASIADAIFVTDPAGRITMMNRACEQLLGWDATVIGKSVQSVTKLFSPDGNIVAENDRPFFNAMRSGKAQRSDSLETPYFYLRADGSTFPITFAVAPFNIGGRIAGAVNVFRDISNEMALSRAKELSEITNTTILASIADAIFVADTEGRITLMNAACEKILGWNSAAVGKTVQSMTKLLSPDGAVIPEKERPFFAAMRTGQPLFSDTLETPYQYLKDDGSTFPINFSVAPFFVAGALRGAVIVFRDVSDEVVLEKTKSEFVSMAAHQLRTPITGLKWTLEMLAAGKMRRTKAQNDLLQNATKLSADMGELVSGLLNVARVDLDTYTVDPVPTDFIDVCDSVLGELVGQVSEKKTEIVKRYAAGIPEVTADPGLIRFIFENLLTNAVRYTPPGGKVTISIAAEKDVLHVAVSDNGYGIPKAQQGKIFGKMFRADNAKEKVDDGTGIGLYATKQIVERSGGRIWFESEENKGTTFHVTIPLAGMPKKTGTSKIG